MKTPVSVEVLDREFTLQVEEGNVERTRRVAEQVNRRMRAFQRRHPGQAKLTTAIITALALGEDLQQERDTRAEHDSALSGDLRTLTTRLTDALDEDALDEDALDDGADAAAEGQPADAETS
jgi:cell division protein ZapA (FtsZ GTPase activity inhibitor)